MRATSTIAASPWSPSSTTAAEVTAPIVWTENCARWVWRTETIAQAWREAEDDYGIDPCRILRDQLRRRLPTRASSYDEAAIRRVYNALLRAGFDEGDVRSALAPHMRDQDADAEAAPADEATTDHPDQRSRETRTNDDSQ